MSTSKFFQRRPKLHEPVGQVQFVVFEKIYQCLFISNCMRKIMWLLINNMYEKIRDGYAEEMHAYHAIREKLHHKIASSKVHAWFESKRFDCFSQKPHYLLASHNPEFRCVICTGITLFALVLHILHSFLSQSELSNFFVYIIK